MKKPLLFMRKRSLLGTFLGDHFGFNRLSKSAGHYIANGFRAVAGWTGTAACAVQSDTIHSVTFNRDVYFTDHTGVSFHNLTTGEIAKPALAAALYTSVESSPSRTITYNNIEWVNPPIAGEVIEFRYRAYEFDFSGFVSGLGGALIRIADALIPFGSPGRIEYTINHRTVGTGQSHFTDNQISPYTNGQTRGSLAMRWQMFDDTWTASHSFGLAAAGTDYNIKINWDGNTGVGVIDYDVNGSVMVGDIDALYATDIDGLTIGGTWGATQYMQGVVKDFRVYDQEVGGAPIHEWIIDEGGDPSVAVIHDHVGDWHGEINLEFGLGEGGDWLEVGNYVDQNGERMPSCYQTLTNCLASYFLGGSVGEYFNE